MHSELRTYSKAYVYQGLKPEQKREQENKEEKEEKEPEKEETRFSHCSKVSDPIYPSKVSRVSISVLIQRIQSIHPRYLQVFTGPEYEAKATQTIPESQCQNVLLCTLPVNLLNLSRLCHCNCSRKRTADCQVTTYSQECGERLVDASRNYCANLTFSKIIFFFFQKCKKFQTRENQFEIGLKCHIWRLKMHFSYRGLPLRATNFNE